MVVYFRIRLSKIKLYDGIRETHVQFCLYLYVTGDSRTSQEFLGGKILSENSQRKDIRVPVSLIEKVEEYRKENSIRYWTTAFMELARKGLEAENNKKSLD